MADEKRPYRMKRRAELEEPTRRRITESAVALHGTLGPARTSISALAEHAGVRRSTVYRHFPDEASLFAACTAHWVAENPVPDIGAWAAIEDPDARLRAALDALYPYYRRTAGMMENLIRDEPVSEVVRQNFAGYHQYLAAAREALAARPARRGAGRARASAPRSATRWPSRRGARSRSTRASTTRRPPSSWCGWWPAERCPRQRPRGWSRSRSATTARRPAGRWTARGSPTARSATCRSSTASPRAGRAAGARSPCWWRPRASSPSRRTSSPTPTATPSRRAAVPRGSRAARRGRRRSSATSTPDLGPEGRRWMYFHILPERDLGRAYNCTGVPAWERRPSR